MSFSGNQYPSYANKVITTRGDIVRGSSTGARERLGLGSANQVLQSDGTDIDWETLALADSTLTTQGDVLYQSASGLARLGQSTDGYVLTTKGAAANPVWAAASGSTWELLDQHDVANDATEADTTYTPASPIPMIDSGDYNALYVLGKGRSSATCNMQIILNGLSEFHTQYTLNTSGSSITAVADTSASEIDVVPISLMNGARPFSFGMWIVQQYGSATKEQLDYWGFGNCGNNRGFCVFRGNAVTQSDADISSIKFQVSDSTTYTGVQFAIYGIKQ